MQRNRSPTSVVQDLPLLPSIFSVTFFAYFDKITITLNSQSVAGDRLIAHSW